MARFQRIAAVGLAFAAVLRGGAGARAAEPGGPGAQLAAWAAAAGAGRCAELREAPEAAALGVAEDPGAEGAAYAGLAAYCFAVSGDHGVQSTWERRVDDRCFPDGGPGCAAAEAWRALGYATEAAAAGDGAAAAHFLRGASLSPTDPLAAPLAAARARVPAVAPGPERPAEAWVQAALDAARDGRTARAGALLAAAVPGPDAPAGLEEDRAAVEALVAGWRAHRAGRSAAAVAAFDAGLARPLPWRAPGSRAVLWVGRCAALAEAGDDAGVRACVRAAEADLGRAGASAAEIAPLRAQLAVQRAEAEDALGAASAADAALAEAQAHSLAVADPAARVRVQAAIGVAGLARQASAEDWAGVAAGAEALLGRAAGADLGVAGVRAQAFALRAALETEADPARRDAAAAALAAAAWELPSTDDGWDALAEAMLAVGAARRAAGDLSGAAEAWEAAALGGRLSSPAHQVSVHTARAALETARAALERGEVAAAWSQLDAATAALGASPPTRARRRAAADIAIFRVEAAVAVGDADFALGGLAGAAAALDALAPAPEAAALRVRLGAAHTRAVQDDVPIDVLDAAFAARAAAASALSGPTARADALTLTHWDHGDALHRRGAHMRALAAFDAAVGAAAGIAPPPVRAVVLSQVHRARAAAATAEGRRDIALSAWTDAGAALGSAGGSPAGDAEARLLWLERARWAVDHGEPALAAADLRALQAALPAVDDPAARAWLHARALDTTVRAHAAAGRPRAQRRALGALIGASADLPDPVEALRWSIGATIDRAALDAEAGHCRRAIAGFAAAEARLAPPVEPVEIAESRVQLALRMAGVQRLCRGDLAAARATLAAAAPGVGAAGPAARADLALALANASLDLGLADAPSAVGAAAGVLAEPTARDAAALFAPDLARAQGRAAEAAGDLAAAAAAYDTAVRAADAQSPAYAALDRARGLALRAALAAATGDAPRARADGEACLATLDDAPPAVDELGLVLGCALSLADGRRLGGDAAGAAPIYAQVLGDLRHLADARVAAEVALRAHLGRAALAAAAGDDRAAAAARAAALRAGRGLPAAVVARWMEGPAGR